MRSKQIPLGVLLAGLMMLFSFAASAAAAQTTRYTPGAFEYFPSSYDEWKDDFTSATLDARWSWVRPDATHWSLSAAPGFIRITTQTGGLYGQYYALPNNLLLANVPPSGDFEITTKVTFSPSAEVQTVGLLFYQDDDNYLNLVHVYNYGRWISFHKEVAASPEYQFYPSEVPESTVYLRIRRSGSWYVGYFSTNGITWNWVGAQTISLTSPKVGICAYNSGSGVTEIPADFDFFEFRWIRNLYLPVTLRN